MGKEPICYIKETNEYLYDDLSTREADKCPYKYVFYEKDEKPEDIIFDMSNGNLEQENLLNTKSEQDKGIGEEETNINIKQERYKNFFCYRIDTLKRFDFKDIMKNTYKQYKETSKSKTLIEAIENNHYYCKYNTMMYTPVKTLPVKYLISAIYKNNLIICNNDFQFYKFELIKIEDQQKKQKSSFFSNYRKEEAFKVIQRKQWCSGNLKEEEFRVNFNKTDILFKEGLSKKIFKETYSLINDTVEIISKQKEKENIILTLFRDPLVSKVSCTEINIKREIFPLNFEGVLNQLENEMKSLMNYNTQNFWITKSLESIKATNLFINSGVDIYEAFILTPQEILESLFDEFCLKHKICKHGLKNFHDCKCEIFLLKSLEKGIYGMTLYFDLSESFSLYFLQIFSSKAFEKCIPRNLKYNLLAFIHKTFCKGFINEVYREYISLIITELSPSSYQLFNYKLFIQKEINELNLEKVRKEFSKVNLRVTKVYKSFTLLNEGNYLMEEIRGYEKIFNKSYFVKTELKTVRKHLGRFPKGFINLFYNIILNRDNTNSSIISKEIIKGESLNTICGDKAVLETESEFQITKEEYLNILGFLRKVETSEDFDLRILLEFFSLKNIHFSIFNPPKREITFLNEFCKCGNYKIKDTKCKK